MSPVFDSHQFAEDVAQLAPQHGWRTHALNAVDGFPRPWFHLPAAEAQPLRLYISAGIHGDEPASSYAARELLRHTDQFSGIEVFLFPLLNPAGMARGSRENAHDIDLNRDYHNPASAEISGHLAVLRDLPPCHAYLHLHEDWEAQGAYLYALRRDDIPNATDTLLAAMAEHLPIEQATLIDDFEAEGGVIARPYPLPPRDDWPEPYYFEDLHGTYHGYTLETPSSLVLPRRIAAHVSAAHALANFLREHRATFLGS